VAPIILAAAVGAIFGNLLGFLLGSRGGYRLLARNGHLLRLDERKFKLGQ
jgi:membrane protein DedA with SNARE-associated domain